MTSIPRQISCYATTSSAWSALNDLETGTQYIAPAGGRAVMSGFRILSLSPESSTVQIAVSPSTGLASYAEVVIPILTLDSGDHIRIPDVIVIPAGFSVWAYVVSGDPLVTVTAAILETTP